MNSHKDNVRLDALIAQQEASKTWAAQQLKAKYGMPIIAGGEPAVVAHPLAPPTISGTEITVDFMLRNPTRITRMIMDLSLQRFIVDRVFTSGGGVTGGAVIYDEAVENELYTNRDIEEVSPGAEFPIITSERRVPKIAPVRKWGGKVFITDEAKERNETVTFTNQIRQLTNTIIRKINAIGITTLMNSISASGQTTIGNNWNAVVTGGSGQSNNSLWPAADFAKAQMLADVQELGITYNLWLLNPAQMHQLRIIYGNNLRDVAGEYDVEFYSSNRVPAGTAIVVAKGQVGGMRVEKPLGTETWREEKTERNWIQASVRPVFYVDQPYGVLQFTGLAG